MSADQTDFDRLLSGLTLHEEDHVFIPIGKQSAAVAALHNELAGLLDDDGEPAGEHALGESFTDRRDDLNRRIAEQIEADHKDAHRIRLRALTDADLKAIMAEIDAMILDAEKTKTVLTREAANTAAIVRQVQRAICSIDITLEQVEQLRGRLNSGEWGRLVTHVMTMSAAEAEDVTHPNS